MKRVFQIAILAITVMGLQGCSDEAFAVERVDMDAVMRIESSGNPKAFNERSKAIGLFQITPIVMQEYNERNWDDDINAQDLYDPDINRMVATWYMNVRIPQMLNYYKVPDTVTNRLISYNAGIRYAVEGRQLPEETMGYLQKYEAEVRK